MKAEGVFEARKGPCIEDWIHHIVQVGYEHNIPVVDSYSTLNGPDGDVHYADKYTTDGVHFNAEGYAIVAQLHQELGYEPLGR